MMDVTRSLDERYLLVLARQEIEDLRRQYCRATDALGRVDDSRSRQYGEATFYNIFSDDVAIRVTGTPAPLSGTGPAAWIDIVSNALAPYESTQHLIGTQVVDFLDVQIEDGQIHAGEAVMTSYLQAWHAWPDRRLRLVMGTYTDKVRWYPGSGWRIYDMVLEHTSREHRMLGEP